MRTRTIIASSSLLLLLVTGIVVAVIWLRPTKQPTSPTPEPVAVPSQPEVLMLPTDDAFQTLKLYHHDGPPPWPRGNAFSLPMDANPRGVWLNVNNMHAENFKHIVRELKLETVQVRRSGETGCEIIDPRIPPEWLGNK